MANMDFCDKHNMVAFLQKPTGSEEFQQILDFLTGSHIRYALTENPTIYVSLIEQFWQTVTVKTVNDGEQQLTVTVDGQTIAITEASVRRHLQLADVDGISSLPNTKILDQFTLMGYVSNNDKLTFQKGVHIPLFDTMLIHVQPGQGEGPTLSVESQQYQCSPTTSQPTTSQPMSSQEQPSQALTKLVKKVKYLEDKLKSITEGRKAKMVISDDEEDLISEDPSKQGRMTETEDEGFEHEGFDFDLDQTDTLQQITPTKVSHGEEQSQESSEVQLYVLSAAKILAEASRERVKTYNRKKRSTNSSRDSTAGGLFSTAEEILSTNERIAQNLNEEEMAKAERRTGKD
ncbi:hypothetical protein Tco_0749762 [Tanacetum coccineum]|uniref:Xylulose kinase-1 n=1 Tax=Tanacetum coccineum TaxID=301880 RepID=A0ABQ4Z1Z5_9ASTR